MRRLVALLFVLQLSFNLRQIVADDDVSFPVLDLGAFIHGTEAEREAWGREFYDVLTIYGFYYISNHGIPEEIIQNAFKDSKEFFDQPADVKESHRKDLTRDTTWGYLPERVEAILEKPDVKELFDFNCSGLEEKYDANPFWSQTTTMDLFLGMKQVSVHMLEAYAMALGHEADVFSKHFVWEKGSERTGYYTFFKYPPIPVGSDDTKTPPHTDTEAITLVIQDQAGGLQAWHATAEKWVDLHPIPGTIVVNTGNLMQRWTNNHFVSTIHQVHPHLAQTDRYSLIYFVNPNGDTMIDTKDIFPDEEREYAPVTVSDFYLDRIKALYKNGRVDMVVNSETAEAKPVVENFIDISHESVH